jgi:uncharacterized phage-associated protein
MGFDDASVGPRTMRRARFPALCDADIRCPAEGLPRSTMRAFHREKLLYAMVFFVKRTKACHKLKLFKLLYFLDFDIYRQTGKSATGLRYFAWKMGPVPRDLYEELSDPAPDMKAALMIRQTRETDPDFTDRRLLLTARVDFDDQFFTRRELRVMETLAEVYQDATGTQMSEVSHLRGTPWHQVWEVLEQHQHLIPYALALDSRPDSITPEQASEIEEEAREVAALFK